MSNKNFGEPWEGKIERIRENLREGRYALVDGIFPIVKELIQNAEDAPAKRLLVAWENGLPDAKHPLLQGPGLLAINDGGFDDSNGKAIREMGLSSKSADSSTIGKFGLGMKSIFHLGEVFFFVAVDESGKQIDADVRNPWSTDDGGLHADWDEFGEADQIAIATHVRSLFGNGRWFCLWVPLRTSTNCGNVDPIESYYPGDESPRKLLGAKEFEMAAAIVPLLAHLELVQFRTSEQGRLIAHDIRVADYSSRRAALLTLSDSIGEGTIPKFEGQVESKQGLSTILRIYSGEEYRLKDIDLCKLESDEAKIWPKRFATNKITGKSEQVPEKASQHAAVCFSAVKRSQSRSQLRIHWAVFLPLGQPETFEIDSSGWDVDVVLHGWFFPNSGRTEIEGLDKEAPLINAIHDSATVRLAWNHRLASCGTLPLLPEVCANIALKCIWDDSTRIAITKGIQQSSIFSRFRSDVCQRNALVKCMNKSGNFEWQIVPSNKKILCLPDTQDERLPSKVFPELRSIAEEQVIVLKSAPRLTLRNSDHFWPAEFVRKLLSSVSTAKLISFPTMCEYFIQFLDNTISADKSSLFSDELVKLTRSALIEVRGKVTNETHNIVLQLLSLIPNHRRIRVPFDITDDFTSKLFLILCRCTDAMVLVPDSPGLSEFDCNGQFTVLEALDVLKKLSEMTRNLPSQQADTLGVVAALVFQATDDQDLLHTKAGNKKLFSGRNCCKQKDTFLSWSDIRNHHRRRTLFVKPSPLANHLQDALANDSIVLISKAIADIIFNNHNDPPSQCSQSQMLAALTVNDKPSLSDSSHRLHLFKTLLKYVEGRREPHFRECVRFILHGKSEYFSSTEPLLVQADSGNDVWWRLAQISLTALSQKWRIVDPDFSVVMSAQERIYFVIKIVDPEVAGQLATSVAADTFSSLRPSETEYATLIKHLVDDDLLKRLPIHQDIEGKFVSLTDRCYWQGKWPLPIELQHTVSILKRANDEYTLKRQLQLRPSLDALAVINIALTCPNPERHWSLIMDCLTDANSLPEATKVRLKSTAWIPLANGIAARPEDVLYLPQINDDVARLVAEHPDVFVDLEALSPAIRSHAAFATFLAKVVPGISDALVMLGTLLLEDERNAVGIAEVSFEDWVKAFQDDEGTLFPQIKLLRAVSAKLPNAAENTFALLKKPIPEQRTRQLLAFLHNAHVKKSDNKRSKTIIRVFGKYLKQLLSEIDYQEGIRDTELPTANGDWKSPHELCLTNDGISSLYVLDQQIEEQIASFLPDALQTKTPFLADGSCAGNFRGPDWNVSAAAERLHEYFDSWRDLVPNEQIGGFLSLLGDDASIRELAQEFLGRNRTLEETREKFGLPEMQCGCDPAGVPIMEDAQTMIRKQRVVVEIADEPNVRVLNLLGNEVNVPLNVRPMTIFVGYGTQNNPFPQRIDQGLRLRCFRLNAIDPSVFRETDLSQLLRNSATKFIGEAYNCWESQTQFAATWDELAASDQLDIRITQSRIIEHGFLILAQYGLRSDPKLARVLARWDAADRLKAERDTQACVNQGTASRDPDQEMDNVRADLRRLFDEPPITQTQQLVLNAVKHRLADYYQYNPSSIPFELFQNADDAYAELNCFFPGPLIPRFGREPTFDLLLQPTRVVCIHFGRRINQYSVDADQTTHEFDNDLWNMSVLSLSNKGQGGDASVTSVTGKFGLGFKSVFLACDRPRLLSGRLAFEFIGGIYPRRLVGEERRVLDELRHDSGHNNPQVTIIDLELREDVDVTQVVQRFQRLAHILVVFARQIRRCICGEPGTETSWHPTEVPGISGCQTGDIKPLPSNDCKADSHRVLLFQSEAGAFLFALGSQGFKPFDSDIPTVWVIAPTEVELQLGFLVNGLFELDVGRAQLVRDPAKNHSLAHQLGQRFGKQLAEFFAAFNTPSSRTEIQHALHFAADVKSFDIWNSLWERLVVAVSERVRNDQPADQLIRDILWQSSDSGVAHFYSQYEVIPVGLPGKLFESELVSLANVIFSVRGVLAQRDQRSENDGYALARILNWPTFRERVGSGKLVSHERVILPLNKLCPSLVENITAVTLADVLKWECPHSMIDPGKAERFGELITREFLTQIKEQSEMNRIRDTLNLAEFLAVDGKYYAARELLSARDSSADCDWNTDECLLTGFAPPSRVLSDQYSPYGLRFFYACREKLSTTSQEKASWIRDAREHATRKSALTYLANGNKGRLVQTELRRQGLENTWLIDLKNAPSFRELSISEMHRLADLLSVPDASDLIEVRIRNADIVRQLNPKKVLQNIHDWWTTDGPRKIQEYVKRVYPNGGLHYLADQSEDNAQKRRKDWMTLFLIGLTHTMGRTVAEQHRGFLRQCEREGWLDMIAASERQPGPWMKWIENFLDQQIDDSRFLQWMKQFVGIYQVSRHFDDYIEVFLAAQRFQHPFTLTQLTNTRASSDFQAGGISAPPLSRVLGMGQCFVLRELLRLGVLSNSYAYPHCFVPVARVRRMMINLGCNSLITSQQPWEWSRDIFAFLQLHLGGDAAKFGGAFDIPLQIVADDMSLQMRFFDTAIESDDDESALWFNDNNSAELRDQ
jgi:hypothetical protein